MSNDLNESELALEDDAVGPKDRSVDRDRPDPPSAADQAKDKEQEMEDTGEELPG